MTKYSLLCAITLSQVVNLVIGVSSALNAESILQIGQHCTENQACSDSIPNSYCDFVAKLQCNVGVCNCLPTHVATSINSSDPSNITCLLKPTDIGDPCQHNIQCISSFGEHSSCVFPSDDNSDSGTCQCATSTVLCTNTFEIPHVKKCRPLQKLGEYCDDNCESKQCNHIPNAFCRTSYPSRCSCDYSFFMQDETTCVPKGKLGGLCDIHPDQCIFAVNSYCDPTTSTCVCNTTTHVTSTYNNACYPRKKYLGMECRAGVGDCQPSFSICALEPGGERKYACRCDTRNYVESKMTPNTCILLVASIGRACTEDIQCSAGQPGINSECSGNETKSCQCKEGYVYSDKVLPSKQGFCYPKSPLNGTCEMDRQCFDKLGSSLLTTCTSLSCGCSQEASEFEGICYKNAQIGDKCEIDAECKASIEGFVLCDKTTKTCACDDGYAPSKSSTATPRCIQKDILNGEKCSEDWQCYGPTGSAECNNSVCRCQGDFEYSEEIQSCVEKVA